MRARFSVAGVQPRAAARPEGDGVRAKNKRCMLSVCKSNRFDLGAGVEVQAGATEKGSAARVVASTDGTRAGAGPGTGPHAGAADTYDSMNVVGVQVGAREIKACPAPKIKVGKQSNKNQEYILYK